MTLRLPWRLAAAVLSGFIALAAPAAAQSPADRAFVVTPDLLRGLEWRGIGPAATGGRIADIAVARTPGRPLEIYAATTTGGVFKSVNEGVSWTPVFDRAGGMMSIGAVAVAPSNPSVVWVGTGEADNRQSSSWGDGVYKSIDGGFNWQKMGLGETRHVGKIVIHPTDPNTVYVAAVGHLWGSNPERGVYKTTDGGLTWKLVLSKDENTGAIDLAMDPGNPNVVFAAMYQRQRKGWGYNGGGPGSGIYRTTDGGATWTELKNGLPRGDKGRIGLAIFAGNSRTVYAIVEADAAGGGRAVPPTGSRPETGSPATGRAGDQGGVFRSLDQGDNWERLNSIDPRPSYYSKIYVDPKQLNRVYIMGSNRGLYLSDDGGRSFSDVFSNVHGEDHVLWVDPENTNHLVIGGDGGVSISFDRGLTWLYRINLPIGQFYNISAGSGDPYLVCGGLQDNGSWCTPSATNSSAGISFKEAFNIGGGDGMQALFDGDGRTVLVSSQNGVTARLDLDSMERQVIGPVQPLERPHPGQPVYRWYWTTPLIVSHFDPKTIYTGANVLFRSEDRGASWKAISPDLTSNIDRERLQMMGGPVPPRALSRNDGQSNFSALTVIAESPLDHNLLYTGADDGAIQMTRDGGKHWTNLTAAVRGLPPMLNISGIVASRFAPGRVYVTVDGHFNDDYHAYVFVSEDYGQTWRAIAGGLPQASVHRLREHPANPAFLAAGLETGVYATFDRGEHWTALNLNMPPVPVYDLMFQESNALVLGTHGRSIWVLDHIEPLSQIRPDLASGGGYLFPAPAAHHQVIYSGQFWFGAGEFFAPNPPSGAVLTYYLAKPANEVRIAIADAAGKPVRTLRGPALAGLNRTCWDLRHDPASSAGVPATASCIGVGTGGGFGFRGLGPLVLPGKYKVTVAPAGGPELNTEVVSVGPDPRFTISDSARKTRYAAVMSAYSLEWQLTSARDAAQSLSGQIAGMRAAGEAGRNAQPVLDRISVSLSEAQGQISQSMNEAATAQGAMDSYSGAPTAAQLRQLDWAWEDAAKAVAALNRVIEQELPRAYSAIPGYPKPPEARRVAVPSRKQ